MKPMIRNFHTVSAVRDYAHNDWHHVKHIIGFYNRHICPSCGIILYAEFYKPGYKCYTCNYECRIVESRGYVQ